MEVTFPLLITSVPFDTLGLGELAWSQQLSVFNILRNPKNKTGQKPQGLHTGQDLLLPLSMLDTEPGQLPEELLHISGTTDPMSRSPPPISHSPCSYVLETDKALIPDQTERYGNK